MIRTLVALTVLAYALVLFAVVLSVALFVAVVLGIWKLCEMWVDRDRTPLAIVPLRPEECETCGKEVSGPDLVEVSDTSLMPEFGGGVTMTATFCKTCAPEEANR